MTRMQYPYDLTGENPLFDGQMHTIVPESVYPVLLHGRQFFIMEYFDQTANTHACTMLIRCNGVFYKVPLDDYRVLFNFLEVGRDYLAKNRIPGDKVQGDIFLAEMLPARELFDPEKCKEANLRTPLELWQYTPLNPEGITDVRENSFSAFCTIIKINDEVKFMFSKELGFPLKDAQIQYGTTHYSINEEGVKTYDFVIDVPEGTFADKYVIDEFGQQRVLRALVIPGLHAYHITYSDFFVPGDYSRARESERIEIKATYSEFKTRDYSKAFAQGGAGILDMEFIKGKNQGAHLLTKTY